MDALLGQLFDGLSPVILAWYRDQTGIAEKRCRLDMLVTKIRSIVEVSEKTEIQSESLRKWQQKFKDAANQGDEMLCKIQDQLNSTSSSSSSGGNYSLFERFISRREDMNKLNSTIELLEQSSAQVNDFLQTLKLDLSELARKVVREASVGNRSPPTGLINLPVMGIKSTVHSDTGLRAIEESSTVSELGKKRERPGSPGWLGTHTCREPKKGKPLSPQLDSTCAPKENMHVEGASAAHSRTDSDQLEKVEMERPECVHQELEEPNNKLESEEDPKLEWLAKPLKLSRLEIRRKPKECRKPKLQRLELEKRGEKKCALELEVCAEQDVFGNMLSGSVDPKFSDLDIFREEKKIVDDVAVVEGLVAQIQAALDMTIDHGAVTDISWFGLWITKLRKAMEEGSSVASAIKSNKYRANHDQTLDEEVGVILSNVRLRLESLVSDLENFRNLVEAEKLVRELTPGPSKAK